MTDQKCSHRVRGWPLLECQRQPQLEWEKLEETNHSGRIQQSDGGCSAGCRWLPLRPHELKLCIRLTIMSSIYYTFRPVGLTGLLVFTSLALFMCLLMALCARWRLLLRRVVVPTSDALSTTLQFILIMANHHICFSVWTKRPTDRRDQRCLWLPSSGCWLASSGAPVAQNAKMKGNE